MSIRNGYLSVTNSLSVMDLVIPNIWMNAPLSSCSFWYFLPSLITHHYHQLTILFRIACGRWRSSFHTLSNSMKSSCWPSLHTYTRADSERSCSTPTVRDFSTLSARRQLACGRCYSHHLTCMSTWIYCIFTHTTRHKYLLYILFMSTTIRSLFRTRLLATSSCGTAHTFRGILLSLPPSTSRSASTPKTRQSPSRNWPAKSRSWSVYSTRRVPNPLNPSRLSN